AILCFLYAWNDFFFALILTRTTARTAPVAVVNFMNYEGWEWGKIAAGGSLVMAPVLIFSLAVRRYLVSGLTAGAVKGGQHETVGERLASFSFFAHPAAITRPILRIRASTGRMNAAPQLVGRWS